MSDFMQLWYRDILMFKVTKDINTLVFKDEYGVVSGLCQKSSYEGLETIFKFDRKGQGKAQCKCQYGAGPGAYAVNNEGELIYD